MSQWTVEDIPELVWDSHRRCTPTERTSHTLHWLQMEVGYISLHGQGFRHRLRHRCLCSSRPRQSSYWRGRDGLTTNADRSRRQADSTLQEPNAGPAVILRKRVLHFLPNYEPARAYRPSSCQAKTSKCIRRRSKMMPVKL